jgi:hypothetical protein
LVVPSKITFAEKTGSPDSPSTTLPLTVVCAIAATEHTKKKLRTMNLMVWFFKATPK